MPFNSSRHAPQPPVLFTSFYRAPGSPVLASAPRVVALKYPMFYYHYSAYFTAEANAGIPGVR